MSKDYIEYRPGMRKVVRHLEHLSKMQKGEPVSPIHVSVFPNNFCQLNCEYCCFKETERNTEELNISDFKLAVDVLTKYGLKALELSGGGEPLLWTYFDEAVEYAYSKGLKLSMVTNGLALSTKSQEILSKFNWIRPSVQSTKYAKIIPFDYIPSNVKKSMSFIVYNSRTLDEIKRLYDFAKEKNIIIRVAPIRPCTESFEIEVKSEVEKYGKPLIFFEKERGAPLGCYMLWIRAAIDWKGNFLPCPSIELSPEYFGRIPDSFAVCKIKDLEKWLLENPVHDLGYRCSFCNCGKDTNDFIYNMLEKVEDEDFV